MLPLDFLCSSFKSFVVLPSSLLSSSWAQCCKIVFRYVRPPVTKLMVLSGLRPLCSDTHKPCQSGFSNLLLPLLQAVLMGTHVRHETAVLWQCSHSPSALPLAKALHPAVRTKQHCLL